MFDVKPIRVKIPVIRMPSVSLFEAKGAAADGISTLLLESGGRVTLENGRFLKLEKR